MLTGILQPQYTANLSYWKSIHLRNFLIYFVEELLVVIASVNMMPLSTLETNLTKSQTGHSSYAYLKSGFILNFLWICSFKSIYLHFSSISWHLKTSKGTLSRQCTIAINPGRIGNLFLTVWNNFFQIWKISGFLSPLKSLW